MFAASSGALVGGDRNEDLERSTKENEEGIREDLTWLVLTWDETFNQSERFDRYKQAAEALKDKGLLYP